MNISHNNYLKVTGVQSKLEQMLGIRAPNNPYFDGWWIQLSL